MPALGLALALVIGSLLGLLGGGGSILAVPVFVYVLGLDPKIAIATSLGVVGVTSLLAAWPRFRAGEVDLRRALTFAAGSAAGAYAGALLSKLLSGDLQLVIFAVMMVVAAVFMFRGRRGQEGSRIAERTLRTQILIVVQGVGVGLLTGLVGVGGGFMIVPVLVLLGSVSMKRAVGTSLFVIAINSLFGLAGYLMQEPIRTGIAQAEVHGFPLPGYLALFTGVTVVGATIGSLGTRLVDATTLRRAFAVFLVVVAAGMVVMG
jgi:uncharacterized membrane protein YfcA